MSSLLYFWIVLLVVVSAFYVSDSAVVCDGMVFHDVYHDKELLFEAMGKPYSLMMHKSTGLLFFSHTIWSETIVDFGIMACHLEKKSCRDIPGISGGYAVAYDRKHDDVFFGGHNGIYKYNPHTRTAKFFAEEGKSIWGLYIGRYFYYIEYPAQKLYVLYGNRFGKVVSAKNFEIDNFYVSRDLSIYFSNMTGLYKVDKAFRAPIVLKQNLLVRQITEDMYGDIYFCADDGVYVEWRPYNKIKKVAVIDDCYGLTFMNIFLPKTSRDLIIYSSKDSIYRLLPSKYSDICLEAIFREKKHLRKPKRFRMIAH